jgi:hypothetical protein
LRRKDGFVTGTQKQQTYKRICVLPFHRDLPCEHGRETVKLLFTPWNEEIELDIKKQSNIKF